MTIAEKTAYLKGLYEGLGYNRDKDDGKLFGAIIDTLGDIAEALSEHEEMIDELGEELDAVSEDLSDVEDVIFDEDEEEDDEDEYGACDCNCDECSDEEELYEVVCPTCSEKVYIDSGVLDEGKISCPACGEELEFELDGDEDEEDGE